MNGYAYRFLEKWFGGPVRIAPSTPAMAVTSKVIVGNNPDRVGLILVNLSAFSVWIAPDNGGVPSSSNGILLGPSGGTITMAVDQDGPLPSYGWNGIASAGTPSLFVLEIIGGP